MSTRNWLPHEVLNPRGAWSSTGLLHKNTPSRASVAQNVRVSPGQVYSREGTSSVVSVAGAVFGMYDWITPTDHHVAMKIGPAISRYRVSDGNILQLLATVGGGYAPSFADLGPRLYLTAYNTSGVGTIQANVYDGVTAVDTAFRPPLTVTAMTATDGGAGNCTQGTHKIGFIFQSRSGFSGKPSPVIASVFTPVSVTLNAGLRSIHLAITLDTPADAGVGSAIYPIITRADNPSQWYFVPDTFAILPASTAGWTQNLTISVSDEDLAASAESATNQFNLLTQDAGGTGPFNVDTVAAYGLRMTYRVGNQLYVSAINDPQRISADFNVVQILNQRKMAIQAPLNQTMMLYGDKWTGSVTDNGDEPATWAQPSTISDSIGAPFPNCVEPKTAGNFHWVVAESGAYRFDGAYPPRPITYYESDNWQRINWAAAHTVQIKDDIVNLRLYVAVPLDGATTPNYLFCIDYTNGFTPETCDISLDQYFGGAPFQSIAMVKELASNRTALWIGPSSAGSIVHVDPTTHNDNNGTGFAIHGIWESGYVRESNEIPSKTIRVGNADVWARGSGNLLLTALGLDRSIQAGPDYLPLSTAPGIELASKFDLNPVENYTMRFETNGLNEYFSLSGFRTYARPSIYTR